MKTKNRNLTAARREKNDEFYTQLKDIERELACYDPELFRGKVVYCNCDDPPESGGSGSEFARYFSLQFERLGLKRLVTTSYRPGRRSRVSVYEGDKNGNRIPDAWEWEHTPLKGDGDFRSPECVEQLAQADIVITNPPFSLFREYLAQLVEYGKEFLIIGNMNAITYQEVFPLIKDGKVWYGPSIRSGDRRFNVPDDYPLRAATCGVGPDGRKFVHVKGVRWFTNLDHATRHKPLNLHRAYSPELCPKYDNYNAVNIDKTTDIPKDYDGVMGVPITFLDKYCPDQFEIVDCNDHRRNAAVTYKAHGLVKDKEAAVNGKPVYVRILIRKLKGTPTLTGSRSGSWWTT